MTVRADPLLSLAPVRSRDPVLLFVDDEPEILSALRRCFRQEPYVVYTAGGALEGIQWLELTSVDLVIADERMPGMAGTDFLREAKDVSPRTRRGLLTGFPSDTLVRRGLEVGAVLFLYKPWEDRSLRETVRGIFQRCRAEEGDAGGGDAPADRFDLGGEG